MFVQNRWEIYTPSPLNKDGKMLHFLYGVIHDLEGGWACCFIFHDSVQDCSSMGSSYSLMIFWLKISMPGSEDEISQNNSNQFVVLLTSQLTYLFTFRF